MARRTKARRAALQVLFQADFNPGVDLETVREQIAERVETESLREFAMTLYVGTSKWREMLDEKIKAVAQNWSLERMAPTDRNVLRMGAFELIQTDTPIRVVIDEAVELARRFGSSQSSQFVNGILDKLVPEHRRAEDEADRAAHSDSGADSEGAEPSSDAAENL